MSRLLLLHDGGQASRALADNLEHTLVRLGHEFIRLDLEALAERFPLVAAAEELSGPIPGRFAPAAVLACSTGELPVWAEGFPVLRVAAGEGGESFDIVLDADQPALETDRVLREGLTANGVLGGSPLRTIVVSGYFGAGNRGDDVLVQTLLHWLGQIPDTRLVLASPDPLAAALDYGFPAFDRGQPFLSAKWAALASAVLLGPGGLWDDYSIRSVGGLAGVVSGATRSPAHLVQLPLLVRGYGGRFRGVGLGAGPLRDDDSRAAVRLSIELADEILVRDEESLRLLKEISPGREGRLRLAPDLAWAAEVPEEDSPRPRWWPEGRYLAVSLRPWESGADQRAVWDEVVAVALARDLAVLCLPMQPQDADLMGRLPAPEGLRVFHLPPETGHADFMAAVTSAEVMVAMRLHASILGHAVGTPGIGISYHPKVSSHYREVGRSDFVVPMPVPAQALTRLLERVLDGDRHQSAIEGARARREAVEEVLADLVVDLGNLPVRCPSGAWYESVRAEPEPADLVALPGAGVPAGKAHVTSGNLEDEDREVGHKSRRETASGLTFQFTQRDPREGDTVTATFRDPVVGGSRLLVMLKSRCREDVMLAQYVVHEILLGGEVVASFDPALWEPETHLWIATAPDSEPQELSIRTRAVKDCPDWGWGEASSLTVRVRALSGKGEAGLSSSNPHASLSARD